MNRHTRAPCVFPSPSKIPYGGFSPVRLQTEIPPRPSDPRHDLSAARIRHAPRPLYATTVRHPAAVAHQRANRRGIGKPDPSGTLASYTGRTPSRGPWLASGLCCPAGSGLTMTSSAPLASTHRLMTSPAGPHAHGPASSGMAEGPQFTLRDCPSVLPSLPRWTGRLLLTVASPPLVAFADCVAARRPQIHARRFWRGRLTRLQSSLHAAARKLAGPSPTRAFTFELAPPQSPARGVEYNYAGKPSIPAAGLTPASHAALWAAHATQCIHRSPRLARPK